MCVCVSVCMCIHIYIYIVLQLLSCIWLFVNTWTAACQVSLSSTTYKTESLCCAHETNQGGLKWSLNITVTLSHLSLGQLQTMNPFFLQLDNDFESWVRLEGFLGRTVVKNLPASAGDGFNPWVGKITWRRKWHWLQYSCLEDSMDRSTWRATVHGFTKSQTWLSMHRHTHTHTHTHTYTHTQVATCLLSSLRYDYLSSFLTRTNGEGS